MLRGPLPLLFASALLGALCPPAGASNGESGATARSLLLVTFDTTRADRIGAYGYAQAATPTLDRLAAEGLVFETAIAPTPITLPSHASLLTGVLPVQHGVRDNAVFTLGPEAKLLPEVLREAGFRTGAFVGSAVLDRDFGLDQGFEVYRGPTLDDPKPGVIVERRADAVVDDAVEWLGSLEPGERFFVWVHFFDPHFPYDPPPLWRRRQADPYDGEIAFADSQLSRLLHFLASTGRDAGLLTVVTADHGESLGDHGELAHGLFLYQATLRVPLVLHGPGIAPGRVAGTVSTASLPATLAVRAGLPAGSLPAANGPLLLQGDGRPAAVSPDASLFVETHYPYHTHRWRASRGIVREASKLIDGARPELFDLASDPGEQHDLASGRPEEVAALRRRMKAWLDAHPPLGWAARRDTGFGEREQLEALGYVLASVGDEPFDPSLPDARDRLGDVDRIRRAYDLSLEAKRLEQEPLAAAFQRSERDARVQELLESSRALLREVHEGNPRDPEAARHLAVIELRLDHPEEAIALLEPLVHESPGSADLRFALGVSYERAGRGDDAAKQMQAAAASDPDDPRSHRWLAARAEERGDLKEAMRWLAALKAALPPGDTADQVAVELHRLESARAELR